MNATIYYDTFTLSITIGWYYAFKTNDSVLIHLLHLISRTVGKDIMIVERFYPRRHSYLVVINFGSQTQIKDLSSIYYGGEVIADQRGRVGHYLTFHALTLFPGEALIIKLDK